MKTNYAEAAENGAQAYTCPNCGKRAYCSFSFWFEDFHTERLCALVVCTERRPQVNLSNISLPRTSYYLDLIREHTGQDDPCLGFVGVWQGFTRFDDMSDRRRKTIVQALYLEPDAKLPPVLQEA